MLSFLTPQAFHYMQCDIPISGNKLVELFLNRSGSFIITLTKEGDDIYILTKRDELAEGQSEYRRIISGHISSPPFKAFIKHNNVVCKGNPMTFYALNGNLPIPSNAMHGLLRNQAVNLTITVKFVGNKIGLEMVTDSIAKMEKEFNNLAQAMFIKSRVQPAGLSMQPLGSFPSSLPTSSSRLQKNTPHAMSAVPNKEEDRFMRDLEKEASPPNPSWAFRNNFRLATHGQITLTSQTKQNLARNTVDVASEKISMKPPHIAPPTEPRSPPTRTTPKISTCPTKVHRKNDADS